MLQAVIDRLARHEGLNFALTNRIPRRLATRFMGWFSRIEQPIVRDLSMAVWQLFAGDLHLHEARQAEFRSLHDCFVRELKPGARPIDQTPGTLVSPCDGIVVSAGAIKAGTLIQAKGRNYTVQELLDDDALVEQFRNGSYVTVRLTSSMYHRFHAPYDCRVERVTFVPGDTWNVNPAALARVERLYCRNTRVIVPVGLANSTEALTLVPVGAILVASIQLSFLPDALDAAYRGPREIACRTTFTKGDEMGYFRHGSTIVALATTGLRLEERVTEGLLLRVGEPLWRHRGAGGPSSRRDRPAPPMGLGCCQLLPTTPSARRSRSRREPTT